MKLRLQKVTSTRSGLVMGVQIKGPKDSWVRFALLEVPWAEVPETILADYWAWADRDEREMDMDTPLAFE